jgi:hypothetical protein
VAYWRTVGRSKGARSVFSSRLRALLTLVVARRSFLSTRHSGPHMASFRWCFDANPRSYNSAIALCNGKTNTHLPQPMLIIGGDILVDVSLDFVTQRRFLGQIVIDVPRVPDIDALLASMDAVSTPTLVL